MREPRNTRKTRKGRWLVLLSCLSCVSWLFPPLTTSTAADPLYLSRPYDEITLDENNGGVRLKVLPLALPGRKMPAPDDRKQDLEIELLDRPGERFRVGWNNIVGIKFFEELVLAEAETHVKANRFDEAYPYFHFLETRFPNTAGLKEGVENYLWAQIGADFTAGRNDAALALLVELHQRNRERQGVATAFERVTLKLVEERMAAENYRAARGLLRSLTQRYPDKASATATYEEQLRDKAAAALNSAREALAGGKFRDAHAAARQALAIWPPIEGGRELAAEIHQRHPVVAVGVTNAADDWAAQRTGPLVAPSLFAIAAGGENPYRSQVAQIVENKEPRQILLRLLAKPPVTAQELGQLLLASADAQQPGFDPAWADLLAQIESRSAEELLIGLNHPPLKTEAWLTVPLPGSGAYRIESQTAEQTIFARKSPPAAVNSLPLMEIVEQTYADSAAALRGLRRGEVSVLDRVSPWELKSLAASSQIVVGRYALPSVHVLLPNPRRPLAADRTLKRAILYGIDRQSILDRALLDGQTISGCTVISGPFPRGESKNDPHGYAYDEEVAARPYDPDVALALSRLAQPATPPRPLVLVHPADAIPRVACQSIARQLAAVGIPLTLREESPTSPGKDDFDLRYVELAMQEPLVDAWRLLGPRGLAGQPSPAMLLALRKLEGAGDMTAAALRLKEIHALAAAELPVIPL
ncbi:MAG TPA: ABC transporter substrate-binding protein, partial [Pirellulaceae bacterium]|nr:ABC transporter substrate-binding protein [Pirellulaceae bacterium]